MKMGKLFKKKDKEKDLTRERNEKVIPIAQDVLKLVADAALPMGDNVHAHDNVKFDAVSKKILELLLEKDIKYVDTNFLFQLVLQPLEIIKETVVLSLKRSFDLAETKAMGKEYREITLQDMDNLIKFGENGK